jgi:hypothetical protein
MLRIRDVYPGSRILIFTHPGSRIQNSNKRVIELFTEKFVTNLSKRWVWDPGSEIRKNPNKNLFRMPDPGPGVKKAPDPGPQH